jgi:hypothetical protein
VTVSNGTMQRPWSSCTPRGTLKSVA